MTTMRNCCSGLLILTLSVFVSVSASAQTQLIEVLSFEGRPFLYDVNGEKEGLIPDILAELFSRTQLEYTLTVMPIKRAMRVVRLEPYSCVVPIERLQEREAHYTWFSPILLSKYAFYSHKDYPPLVTLADAKGENVSSVAGSGINEYLASWQFDQMETNSAQNGFRVLMRGRVQLWASEVATATYILNMNRLI